VAFIRHLRGFKLEGLISGQESHFRH
jgi:hypothetical protein